MKLAIKQKRKNEYVNTLRYNQIDEVTGKCASTALFCIRGMRFSGKFIPTMTVADVSTLPEYRNQGLVRGIFYEAHARAREYGACVALLHPFSFDFYRQFGYEKISDTVSASFEINKLSRSVPETNFIPIEEKYYDGIITLFRDFSKNRNLMLDRYDISSFLRKRAEAHILLKENEPCGYITFEKDTKKSLITVSEIVFKGEAELMTLISHLGQYSEKFSTVTISDLEPIPELYSFCDAIGARYESRGDLAARILDTEALLRMNDYPDEHGEFTLCVKDSLPTVAGVFRVVYGDKNCSVERINDENEADITANAPQLLRRIFGCDDSTDGIAIRNHKDDFLRAFPKRINGLFEHF